MPETRMPETRMPEILSHVARGHGWLSAHLYFHGDLYSEVCDRVVLQAVAPLVEDMAEPARRWFFIRYEEDGFHVRLRIYGLQTWLDGTVRPAIIQAARSATPLIERLRFVDYEPEVERYGGPYGVALAEELFHHSSETALGLLRKTDEGDRSGLLGKAVLATLVQLHVFFDRRQEAAEFGELYGKGYLRNRVPDAQQQALWLATFEQGVDQQADRLANYVETVWEALRLAGSLTAELDVFHENMRRSAVALRGLFDQKRLLVDGKVAQQWPEVRLRIVSSFVHMMNNRLGVCIRDECYLSVLIYKILGGSSWDES